MEKYLLFDRILQRLSETRLASQVSEIHSHFPDIEEHDFHHAIDDLEQMEHIFYHEEIGLFADFYIALTISGRDFIEQGGFTQQAKERQLQEQKLKHDVRNAKFSLPLSIAAFVVSLIALLLSIFGNPFKGKNSVTSSGPKPVEAVTNK
jgi:hypothetical protein